MTQETLVPDEATEVRRPPYPGFGAFHSFIERLGKTGVPAVIDRHFIGGSGTNQSLMHGALTYLNLIDEESRPTEELHALAENEDRRPELYRQLVERAYAGALALGHRATQNQLDQWFRQQGVNGDTARKAESFFLALAKEGGIEVSPFFKPTRTSATPRKRTASRKKATEPAVATPEPSMPVVPAQQARIHPAVTSLLDKIPAPGTPWTQRERDLLVLTFGNLLDLFHPVVDDAAAGDEKAPQM